MTDKQIILSLTRELEAATKPKWVSVHDAEPKPMVDVILLTSRGNVGVGCLFPGDKDHRRIEFNGASMGKQFWDFEFTHWMPLPEPMKVD